MCEHYDESPATKRMNGPLHEKGFPTYQRRPQDAGNLCRPAHGFPSIALFPYKAGSSLPLWFGAHLRLLEADAHIGENRAAGRVVGRLLEGF